MTIPMVMVYRKDSNHAPGHGYGRHIGSNRYLRDRLVRFSTIVIHTTNNPNKGTKFQNECEFIRDSPHVSCHEVIGKDGTVAFILPHTAVAWHAGSAYSAFTNAHSYGIELHCSQGEAPTVLQIKALTERMRLLIAEHGIERGYIETHRAIALPSGRKSDPEGWSDAEFYRWRATLYAPDFEALWGPEAHWDPKWGIPQQFMLDYTAGRPWGRALTQEMTLNGVQIQRFENVIVTWSAADGVRVWR